MTVSQLIALLQQCDQSAEVVWGDYDGMKERPTAVRRTGSEVELLASRSGTLATMREHGHDVLWAQ